MWTMSRKIRHIVGFALLGLLLTLNACKTMAPSYDYQELAKAALKLGVDIDMEDNHRLYIEASKWMQTPHQLGGNNKNGVDCSGFTQHIYRKVYKKKIPRSSQEQYRKAHKVSKGKLKEGDLVFFSASRSRKQISHVGIYLKNNLFVHTSSSQGVIISNLNEKYYRRNWVAGGRY